MRHKSSSELNDAVEKPTEHEFSISGIWLRSKLITRCSARRLRTLIQLREPPLKERWGYQMFMINDAVLSCRWLPDDSRAPFHSPVYIWQITCSQKAKIRWCDCDTKQSPKKQQQRRRLTKRQALLWNLILDIKTLISFERLHSQSFILGLLAVRT